VGHGGLREGVCKLIVKTTFSRHLLDGTAITAITAITAVATAMRNPDRAMPSAHCDRRRIVYRRAFPAAWEHFPSATRRIESLPRTHRPHDATEHFMNVALSIHPPARHARGDAGLVRLLAVAVLAGLAGAAAASDAPPLRFNGQGAAVQPEARFGTPKQSAAKRAVLPPQAIARAGTPGSTGMVPADTVLASADAKNFSAFDIVDPADFQTWPAWPNGIFGGCSMTMVDAYHAVTAAHCITGNLSDSGVFTPPEDFDLDNTAGGIAGLTMQDSVSDFWLYPSWIESASSPIATDWKDVAWLRFKEPIGAASGWYGFGEASCPWMKANLHTQFAHPLEGPLAGEMTHWSGDFDNCVGANLATIFRLGAGGMSGSSYASGEWAIRAIHSASTFATPLEPLPLSIAVRWKNLLTNDLSPLIDDFRSPSADLVITGFENGTSGVHVPTAGSTSYAPGRLWVHNYSATGSYSGPVTVSIRYSDDANVTGADHLVWSHSQMVELGPLESVVFDPGAIPLDDWFPTDNVLGDFAAFVEGAGEYSTANNKTQARDMFYPGSLVDLKALSLVPMGGSYFPSQRVPVNLSVTNEGILDSQPFKVDFKLHKISGSGTGPAVINLTSGRGPVLSPGEDFSLDIQMPLTGVPAGEYAMEMIVAKDAREGLLDSFDNDLKLGNQVTWARIKVVVPEGAFTVEQDLRANYVATPAGGPYSKDQSLTTAFSVSNYGGLLQNWQGHFWAVHQGTGEVVYVAQGQWGNLASGAHYASAVNVPLANLSPGTWRMIFQVRSSSYDSVISNNVVPAATTFQVVHGGLAGG
jgi:hypothetical protein